MIHIIYLQHNILNKIKHGFFTADIKENSREYDVFILFLGALEVCTEFILFRFFLIFKRVHIS